MIFNNPILNRVFQIQSINKTKKDIINKNEYIKFIFYDLTSAIYDLKLILPISPSIIKNIQKSNGIYTIRAPYGIIKEDIELFLNIHSDINFKNPSKIIGNNIKKLFSLLKLMDFFGNEKFNIQIISDIIIPELNSDIAVELLIFSYDKLCYFSEIKKEIDNAYFELFYQSLEILSKNENEIIKNIDKLKVLDGKIIEELIQKTFRKLIFGKYLIEKEDEIENNEIDENYFDDNEIGSFDFYQWQKKEQMKLDKNKKINIKNLKSLISLLIKKNNLDNIFSLLTREYMYLLSSESINELQNLPNPNFQTEIPISNYENYYDEFPLDININNQLLTLVVYYKKGDKSINACIKLSKNKKHEKKDSEENNNKYCFEILTFLTSVELMIGHDKTKVITVQNNLTSLTNNKSMYSILKVPHFNLSNLLNNNSKEKSEDFFLLSLRISLCDIYSVLSSYLLHDFYNYINDKNISKLTKQLFILLLKNPKLNKKNENNIVMSILLWLNDEINIKEDISEIFYLIKWEYVEDELIFELLFKYSHIILNDTSLENLFFDIFLNKFNKNKKDDIELLFKTLFKVIKKLEYHKLFVQIKKDEKIMENYLNKNYNMDINEKIIEKNIKKNNNRDEKFIDEYIQTDYFEDIYKNIKNNSRNIDSNIDKNNLNKKEDNLTEKQEIKLKILNTKTFNEIKSNPKKLIIKNLKDKSKEYQRKKSNSNKITKRISSNKERSVSKKTKTNENYKFNSSIQTTNIKIDTNKKNQNSLKTNNISVIKKNKNNSKIKDMQIFPINFASLKRFQKINKSEKNTLNKSKENKNYSFNDEKKQQNKNRYYSERTSEKNSKKKFISRIYSEKKIKISFGIVKEICFMNNT